MQNPTAAQTLTITGTGVISVPTILYVGTGAFTSTITGGTIDLGTGGTVDASQAAGTASANRVLASNLTGTNINITGSGSTADSGGNTQATTVSGTNTALIGNVNLTGMVSFASQNAVGTATTLNIAAANSGLYETANLTLTNNVTLSNNAIFRVPTTSVSLILSGVLSGTGGLRKVDLGTLALGAANTYTGKTSISAGTLSASILNSIVGGVAVGSLGAPVTVANGTIDLGTSTATGVLLYTGPGETTDRVLNLAGTTGNGTFDDGSANVTLTSNVTSTGLGVKTFTLQGTGASSLMAGAITDSGTPNVTNVAKAGTGGWTFSATNTYGGTTSIAAGNLTITGGSAIPDTRRRSLANVARAKLLVTNSETIGSLTGGGPLGGIVTIGANTLTIGGDNASPAASYAGAISGTGNVIKIGTGTDILGGTNTFTGGLTIKQGTIAAASVTALGGTGGNTRRRRHRRHHRLEQRILIGQRRHLPESDHRSGRQHRHAVVRQLRKRLDRLQRYRRLRELPDRPGAERHRLRQSQLASSADQQTITVTGAPTATTPPSAASTDGVHRRHHHQRRRDAEGRAMPECPGRQPAAGTTVLSGGTLDFDGVSVAPSQSPSAAPAPTTPALSSTAAQATVPTLTASPITLGRQRHDRH